ncbi:hypothetical protein LCGC14_0322980 [marine sediment metagenome]|uniref:Uncharacterized protein n=1 Tax=marine sediment metagenome TaxID=412755 RepID=A0A0F9TP23_9ZZZZ
MTDKVAKPIPPKTEDELKQLVRDLVSGRVFVNSMIPEGETRALGMVFMVLSLGGLEGIDTSTIGQICEYYHKAGLGSINGFPMFYSAQLINVEDWAKVISMANAIEAATTAVLKGNAQGVLKG